MGQPVPPVYGHVYTATEVRARLEKEHSNLGHSGVSGTLWPYSNALFESKIVKPAGYEAAKLRAELEMKSRLNQVSPVIENINYSDFKDARSFSVRRFVREAIGELKAYFTKKEK